MHLEFDIKKHDDYYTYVANITLDRKIALSSDVEFASIIIAMLSINIRN